eukprot:GHRR01033803.1.p1 GENE.GHRR01033803.1~~GHRR01033803.1.p1  ORF type:complete len:122 (-),score=32.22 GHRR01033803.1:412-777(-)
MQLCRLVLWQSMPKPPLPLSTMVVCRPRHWKQLMAVTGQSFDLDPKTFTLANMFAMQLHKYEDEIARVTSNALKELTIENELKKLADVWKEQKFELHKYQNVSRCCELLSSCCSNVCVPTC